MALNVLIIGAGMYVSGRHGTGNGTVLSALAQVSKKHPIGKVCVTSPSASNDVSIKEATARINALLGTSLAVEFRVLEESIPDIRSYHLAIVCVPDHLHFKYGKMVIENGLHCLMVKPLTPTLQEALELEALRQKHQVYAAVEFHKRFDEGNLLAKRMIAEDRLGTVSYIGVDYSQRITIPTEIFQNWAAQSNIFQYLGIHYVDQIYFLTDYLPKRVCAIGSQNALKELGVAGYDSVHVMSEWYHPQTLQKLVAVFNTNWIDPRTSTSMSDQKYRIIGSKGRLDLDQKNRGVEFASHTEGVLSINPYFSEYMPSLDGHYDFGGYGYKSIAQFVVDVEDLVLKKQQLADMEGWRATFKSCLPATKLVEGANLSLAQNGKWHEIG
ncbi:MAG: gfo/Idh/MocA family oxidoreductase [Cytophagales bacterium]|nr:MAG: gfo/Idh/MocA family oxidoreductase [Cytophagales bacterium]TAF62093.1 MAG: gfo/Idh/MocA family oxidoreductase [Cytophagales bacterium]